MDKGLARLAPLTGFLAVALGVLAFILSASWSDEPDSKAPGVEIAAWMTDDSWAILVTGWVWMLAVVAFVWFLGSLRSASQRGEGGAGRVTSIAYGAGLLFSAFAVSLVIGEMAGASANEFDDRVISPQLAEALFAWKGGAFFAAEVFAGVLAAATAIVVLRTGVLPKWYGWLGLLYGIWLMIVPIGWLALFGFPIWILLTTTLVWMAESKSGTPAAT
jgi:hypothetical protein